MLETHQKKEILAALTRKIFSETTDALKVSLNILFMKQEQLSDAHIKVIFYKGRAFNNTHAVNSITCLNTRLSEILYPEGDKILAHMTCLAEQKNRVSNYLTSVLSASKSEYDLPYLIDMRIYGLLDSYTWSQFFRNADANTDRLSCTFIEEFKERHKLGVETILGILFEKTYINT